MYHSYYFLSASFDPILSSYLPPLVNFFEGVSDHFPIHFPSKNFGSAGSGTECIPSIDFLDLSMTEAGQSKNGVIMQMVAFPL